MTQLATLAALYALLTSCGGGRTTTSVCSPLAFGAVGDGKTDNTLAIQHAVDECAARGGGIVELSAADKGAVYVTGPFTLKSHVYLLIDEGVTLQATNRHSRYVAAFINWVYRPNEALISAKGATDVAIIGRGTIDGASDQADPDDGDRTWYQLAAAEAPGTNPSTRPWVLEFYQCDHVLISGVTLKNQPYWLQALRFSSDVTESGVTINGIGRNSDGVDLVGATNVTLSDLDIRDSDDYIAVKSGLPISPNDPFYSREIGLPQMPTSHVRISNITGRDGQGISIGSEAVNGVNDVVIENVSLFNSRGGFRIKTGRDRGGQLYDIRVDHFLMTGGDTPLIIDSYYSTVGPDPGGPAQPITATTPHVHDIYIQDLSAIDTSGQNYIHGLPESCIKNVVLNDVSIQTAGPGIDLLHMTGTFTNVMSTPPPPDPPFVAEENVTVTTAGITPAIPATPPLPGQLPCD